MVEETRSISIVLKVETNKQTIVKEFDSLQACAMWMRDTGYDGHDFKDTEDGVP